MDKHYTGLNHIFQSRTGDSVVNILPGPNQTLSITGSTTGATVTTAGVSTYPLVFCSGSGTNVPLYDTASNYYDGSNGHTHFNRIDCSGLGTTSITTTSENVTGTSTIGTAIITSETVTTSTITTANITTDNITTGNITTANITTGNVTTDNITTANITTANVTTETVTNLTDSTLTFTGNANTNNVSNMVDNIIDTSADPFSIGVNNYGTSLIQELQSYTEGSSSSLGTYIAISGDGNTVAYSYDGSHTHIIGKSLPKSGSTNYTPPTTTLIQTISSYGEISIAYNSAVLLIGNKVYTRTITGTSQQTYTLAQTLNNSYTHSQMNKNGTVIIVGDTANAIIYFWTGSGGSWTQQSSYNNVKESDTNNFGGPIRMSQDGAWIAVGYSYYSNGPSGSSHRGAWLFFTSSGNTLTYQSTQYPNSVTNQTQYGGTLDMADDGLTVACGPTLGAVGTNIYIYKYSSGYSSIYQTLAPSLTASTFNFSFNHSGRSLFVTANYNANVYWYLDNLTSYSLNQTLALTGSGYNIIKSTLNDFQLVAGAPTYNTNAGIMTYIGSNPTGTLWLNTGTVYVPGTLKSISNTASTSTTTGAILANGGMGVAGIINAGNGKAVLIGGGSQSISNNTSTAVQFQTTTVVNTFGSNLTIANTSSKFTNTSGYTMYLLVTTKVYFPALIGYAEISINVGGVNGIRYSDFIVYSTASNSVSANCSAIVPLSNGDYFEMYAYQNSGGSLTISTNSNSAFSILTIYQLP